ncbi:MAG TPA: hypothetical protein VGD78_06430 [Chthoniobacterales bacterium]
MDSEHDIPSSDDEQPAVRPVNEDANAEAARKAHAAADAATEKLRNATQTKVEQGKGTLGPLAVDES